MNIKSLYSLILIILFFLTNCSHCTSNYKINRDIIPTETYNTRLFEENCGGYFVGRNFEIFIEEVKDEQWNSILENNIFLNRNTKYQYNGIPKLLFFKIVLINTGDIPVEIDGIELQNYNNVFKNITAGYLKEKYKQYSVINFDTLLGLSKLDNDEPCLKDIDFKTDLKKYKGKSINPGDKVITFIAFNRLPAQIRQFNILISVKSELIQKIATFKLLRFEYRSNDKYFIKKKTTDSDL